MPQTVKKALLIGINYTGTSSALGGCINDSTNLKNFMIKNRYFQNKDMVTMNDNQVGNNYPTKRNILIQLRNLVNFANRNKNKNVLLVVSYSGHGTYQRDRNGDESDGRDEALCPIDYTARGFITDDLIKRYFIDKLPSNVKLVMLIDACHSGTMCDLKYEYNCDRYRRYNTQKSRLTRCDIIMVSGCRDNQTSADAYLQNGRIYEYQGAMTAAFIANYSDRITYYNLINRMRRWLRVKRFRQVPQLTSGKLLNVNKTFLLGSYN
jgi:hypothetical protein